jgi:hypothetical protein
MRGRPRAGCGCLAWEGRKLTKLIATNVGSSPAARNPAPKRTQCRPRRYRAGAEGRVSHLKRRYGLDRSWLKDVQGGQIWTDCVILAYNTGTLAVRSR